MIPLDAGWFRTFGRHPLWWIPAALIGATIANVIGDVDFSPGIFGPVMPLSSTTGSADVAVLLLVVAGIAYAGLRGEQRSLHASWHLVAAAAVVAWQCVGHRLYTATYAERQSALLAHRPLPDALAALDAAFGWMPAAVAAVAAFAVFVPLLPRGRPALGGAVLAAGFATIALVTLADAATAERSAHGALEFRTTAFFGPPAAVAAYAAGMALAYGRLSGSARALPSFANLALTAVVAVCVEVRLHDLAGLVATSGEASRVGSILRNEPTLAASAPEGAALAVASCAYLLLLCGAGLLARSIDLTGARDTPGWAPEPRRSPW